MKVVDVSLSLRVVCGVVMCFVVLLFMCVSVLVSVKHDGGLCLFLCLCLFCVFIHFNTYMYMHMYMSMYIFCIC